MNTRMPLNAVAVVSRDVVEPSTLGPQVLHFSIPALQETGQPTLESATKILSAKFRLRGGEVMISKLNPRKNLVVDIPLVLDQPAVASTEFVVLRPTAIDRRFLSYLLRSETTCQWLDSNVRSVTRSHQRVEPEFVTHLRAELPNNETQRLIVKFLDDQVTRIDNIIAARRAQARLVEEELRSNLNAVFGDNPRLTRPLSTLTDPCRPIQYGIVLPGPHFAGGVPVVKGGDVASGRVARAELNRTDPAIESKYARSRLAGGDLVIAIRGSVGEVAEVPAALTGANLTQDAARIAPWNCDPGWLFWALHTPFVQADIHSRITGAMVTGINIDALRRIRIPNTPPALQQGVGSRAERLASVARNHVRGLGRSMELLMELKRSLITAAVTGEFDVSSADGSQVRIA